MTVRLLPKSEIDKRKSEEQRTAIQEGLKVAERVDLLRETLASEETAFENYRTDTLKSIVSEIDLKHQEKDSLESEIIKLRREQKELLIPLDAKWNEVNRAQKVCADWEADLKLTEMSLSDREEQVLKLEQEADVKADKAEDLKKLSSELFSQAEKTLANAKEESASMRNLAQAELSVAELKQLDVHKRESKVIDRESSLTVKENRIESYESDLAKREQVLRAGWKNLERTKLKLNL